MVRPWRPVWRYPTRIMTVPWVNPWIIPPVVPSAIPPVVPSVIPSVVPPPVIPSQSKTPAVAAPACPESEMPVEVVIEEPAVIGRGIPHDRPDIFGIGSEKEG